MRAILITITKCPSVAMCNVATMLINSWVPPEGHPGPLIGKDTGVHAERKALIGEFS